MTYFDWLQIITVSLFFNAASVIFAVMAFATGVETVEDTIVSGGSLTLSVMFFFMTIAVWGIM